MHLLLIACGPGNYYSDLRRPATFTCSDWKAPLDLNNCGKCSMNWSSGGVLPDINLKNIDGTSAYHCTKEICDSLGQCDFSSNKETGGSCIAKKEFRLPAINFVGAEFTCSSNSPNGCAQNGITIDNGANPVIVINGNLNENSDVNISFKTIDIGANVGEELPTLCSYSSIRDIDPQSHMLKNSIDDKYLDASDTKATHLFFKPRLIPGEQHVYIQCQDNSGAISNVAEVKFNVAKGPDIVIPRISKLDLVYGNNYVKYGETLKGVTLYVNGKVNDCKWDNKSASYDDMGKIVTTCKGCAPGGKDQVNTYYTPNNIFCKSDPASSLSVCNGNVGNIKLGSNKYWFACNGTNGKVSEVYPNDNKGFEIIGTNSLNITDINCEQTLGTSCDTIYDPSFGFSIKTIGGAQDGNAQCMWASEGYSFDFFTEPGGEIIAGKSSDTIKQANYAKIHSKGSYQHSPGQLKINFFCNDIAGNLATDIVTINLQRDITPPRILKSYRYGNDLYLLTDKLSQCSYVTTSFGAFDNSTSFDDTNGLEHHTAITGNFYRIRCEDKFNNTRDMNLYISDLR